MLDRAQYHWLNQAFASQEYVALSNAKTSILIQKHHPYAANLNSEASTRFYIGKMLLSGEAARKHCTNGVAASCQVPA